MQDLIFDHVFSPCKDNNLKKTLKDFENAGFLIDSDITKHSFGNYSGFVLLTGSYLEFLEFYDRSLWNPEQHSDVENATNAFRPYGIGVRCADSNALLKSLIKEFPSIGKVFEAGRKDSADSSPIWRFLDFPKLSLPGAYCFSVQYLRHPTERSKFLQKRVGPNGIFAIGGYTFCCADPASDLTRWEKTLQSCTRIQKLPNALRIGVQDFEWINPAEYQKRFGISWDKIESSYGNIAAIKLLTENINQSAESLLKLSNPHLNTGFTFELREASLDKFFTELEKLHVS